VPFTGISGKFWDVLLGRGLLLDEFEKGFAGARAGDEVQFSFTFPDDYSQEELRNKEVEVNAKIRKVFTIPRVETLEDVLGLSIKNTYNFSELDLLREQNEILYFLGLRDHDPGELLRTPAHFLTLIHRKAKLGKHEDIQKLAAFLEGKLTALNALADTLIAAGKPAWALPYYEGLSGIPSTSLKRVKCLLALNRADEALALIRSIPESQELDYQETFVQCLKAAEPDSHRIRPMEFRVMELRVKAALQKEVSSRRPPIPVIVHGDAPVAE
jgi:hypothetical protein